MPQIARGNAAALSSSSFAGLGPTQLPARANRLFDGREDRIGTVEKGKLADLIVIDGDPLAEIKVLTEPARIALVIKDGVIAANRMKSSR